MRAPVRTIAAHRWRRSRLRQVEGGIDALRPTPSSVSDPAVLGGRSGRNAVLVDQARAPAAGRARGPPRRSGGEEGCGSDSSSGAPRAGDASAAASPASRRKLTSAAVAAAGWPRRESRDRSAEAPDVRPGGAGAVARVEAHDLKLLELRAAKAQRDELDQPAKHEVEKRGEQVRSHE